MEKRNLYIVVAIVLVVAVILSVSNLTGRSMGVLGKCRDSDGGDDVENPGTVSYSGAKASYKDECYSSGGVGLKKYVRERYCLDKMKTREYYCFNGCEENVNGEGYCLEGGHDILPD